VLPVDDPTPIYAFVILRADATELLIVTRVRLAPVFEICALLITWRSVYPVNVVSSAVNEAAEADTEGVPAPASASVVPIPVVKNKLLEVRAVVEAFVKNAWLATERLVVEALVVDE
jgi:hypothetical protein